MPTMDIPHPAGWEELRVTVTLESPKPVSSEAEVSQLLETWDRVMGVHWTRQRVQHVIYEGQVFYDVAAEYFVTLQTLTGQRPPQPEENWVVYDMEHGMIYQCVPPTKHRAVAEAEMAGKGHHRAMPVSLAREMANAYAAGHHDGYVNARGDIASAKHIAGPNAEAFEAFRKEAKLASLRGLLNLTPTVADSPTDQALDRGGWTGLVSWYMGEIEAGRL